MSTIQNPNLNSHANSQSSQMTAASADSLTDGAREKLQRISERLGEIESLVAQLRVSERVAFAKRFEEVASTFSKIERSGNESSNVMEAVAREFRALARDLGSNDLAVSPTRMH